jgi:MFS family permease
MLSNRFSALRHRDFRLYWFGYVISVSGQQMLWMLEGWLIYEMTGSKVYLGLHAFAQAVPATALVLVGGVIADKFDQRKLLIAVQIGNIVLLSLLAGLALTEYLEIWHILTIAFMHSAVGSFENPARQSMFPHLVDRAAMPNAIGLNSSIMVYTVTLLKIHLPPIKRSQHGSMLQSMAEGAKFIWRERVFAFLIGLAWYNMAFGISFTVLLPVIAKDILHVDAGSLGMMWGAQGIGSMAGVILSSHYAKPWHQRRSLIFNPILLGGAMIALAFIPVYWVSLITFFLIGMGASATNVAIQQNLQLLVPNELRGRVMGVWSIVHTSIRPMGEVQFSALAIIAAPLSLVVGGAMLIAGSILFTAPSKYGKQLADLRQLALDEAATHAKADA